LNYEIQEENEQNKLIGKHASLQIPKAVSFQKISEVDGDNDDANGAGFFWETAVYNHFRKTIHHKLNL
jgi:DUF1680 family protein